MKTIASYPVVFGVQIGFFSGGLRTITNRGDFQGFAIFGNGGLENLSFSFTEGSA